jgi:predicted nucleic acid-binding protein
MRALADTSILIALVSPAETTPDLADFDAGVLVSTLSWAELAVGLRTAATVESARRRRAEYDELRERFTAVLPFDEACVAAFGQILDRVADAGGQPKARPLDRMIAATALAWDIPLVTRNPQDFAQLTGLVETVER